MQQLQQMDGKPRETSVWFRAVERSVKKLAREYIAAVRRYLAELVLCSDPSTMAAALEGWCEHYTSTRRVLPTEHDYPCTEISEINRELYRTWFNVNKQCNDAEIAAKFRHRWARPFCNILMEEILRDEFAAIFRDARMKAGSWTEYFGDYMTAWICADACRLLREFAFNHCFRLVDVLESDRSVVSVWAKHAQFSTIHEDVLRRLFVDLLVRGKDQSEASFLFEDNDSCARRPIVWSVRWLREICQCGGVNEVEEFTNAVCLFARIVQDQLLDAFSVEGYYWAEGMVACVHDWAKTVFVDESEGYEPPFDDDSLNSAIAIFRLTTRDLIVMAVAIASVAGKTQDLLALKREYDKPDDAPHLRDAYITMIERKKGDRGELETLYRNRPSAQFPQLQNAFMEAWTGAVQQPRRVAGRVRNEWMGVAHTPDFEFLEMWTRSADIACVVERTTRRIRAGMCLPSAFLTGWWKPLMWRAVGKNAELADKVAQFTATLSAPARICGTPQFTCAVEYRGGSCTEVVAAHWTPTKELVSELRAWINGQNSEKHVNVELLPHRGCVELLLDGKYSLRMHPFAANVCLLLNSMSSLSEVCHALKTQPWHVRHAVRDLVKVGTLRFCRSSIQVSAESLERFAAASANSVVQFSLDATPLTRKTAATALKPPGSAECAQDHCARALVVRAAKSRKRVSVADIGDMLRERKLKCDLPKVIEALVDLEYVKRDGDFVEYVP